MYILAIETTGAYASVALTDGTKVLARVQGDDRYSHLQNLMPQVQQVMAESGSQLGDMTAIAVSAGPGSFTGIRIGVSSARALAQVLGIPCVPVSSLEALAMRAAGYAEDGRLICPMLDARRSQVYAGAYRLRDGRPEEVVPAGPYMADAFLQLAGEHGALLLTGDGCDTCKEKIEAISGVDYMIAPAEIRYQNADTVAELAVTLYEETGGVSYEQLQPEYMRIPEAERKLREKRAQEAEHA